MTWQPVDCHAHSTFSDGQLTVAQVVARAAALGVRPSISDHITRAASYAMSSLEEVRAYLDALDAHDVLRAGEFCWHDNLWRELPPDIVRRFTHRLGSMHAVLMPDGRLVQAFSRQLPPGITVEAYMDAHASCVERLARDMPVDVFAHPTLITIPFRGLDIDQLWTEERETRIVDALYSAGIAFEISNRYWPHERIVRRAIARGVRVSLGSDGHTFDQVANITRPLALVRQLGVADADLYDPLRHGSKTQPRAGERAAS
jgi:histidinol phosphatase-like PHP family hydrolase